MLDRSRVAATMCVIGTLLSKRWRWAVLLVVIVPTMLVRLRIIAQLSEPDSDAAGHLGIARALISHPTNIACHWVYLPGYHYLIAALFDVGMSADSIRVLNCILAALLPMLVMRYAEHTTGARVCGGLRHMPLIAALFCAVSPLVNLLGTSAQQETLFSVLVLGTVWSLELSWFWLAGALLAIASLIRYEAWGAVALLVSLRAAGSIPHVARRLPASLLAASRLPFRIVMPSLVAIFGWLLAHKLSDGQWFGFLRELYRGTYLQRAGLGEDGTVLWFPLWQPLYVFGWVVLALFFVGVRRGWRASHAVPLGIYLFLLGAYLFKGALGSARYYESLVPFVALSAAHGVHALSARRRWIALTLFAAAFGQLVFLSTELYRWTWPRQKSATAHLTKSPGRKPHA